MDVLPAEARPFRPWRSLKDALCWIYGPGTVEFDEKRSGTGWLAMLDRVLARDGVEFEEYVEVDNALQPDDSPGERKFIDECGPGRRHGPRHRQAKPAEAGLDTGSQGHPGLRRARWTLVPAQGAVPRAAGALRERALGGADRLGAHARDAIEDAAKLAGYAAQLACDPAAGDEPMPEGLAGNLRESLSKVALPQRPAILRSLDEVQRKCKKAK